MFEELSAKHERLKKRIHAFRIPLSPRGQLIMKVVYFSIPLIGGYFIMDVRSCFDVMIPYDFELIGGFLAVVCDARIGKEYGEIRNRIKS